jgi:hypothetical protein
MIIGVDIDGVLANFNKAYRQRLISVTGRDLIPEVDCRGEAPGEEPPCWDYAPVYGYTKDEDRATWNSIKNDREFWVNLSPLPGAFQALQRFVRLQDAGHEVYYITSRPGVEVQTQSLLWLLKQQGLGLPTVMIARGEKGLLAAGLQLTHFLDDRPENCFSVQIASPNTGNYLLACRYNEWARERCTNEGIHVVATVSDFINDLEGQRERAA